LQLRAIAVAADPREPGVDHETDVRHGQRRFRHVRGKHHAASATGRKDPLLFRRGKPRVERQNVVAIAQFASQQLRCFVDLTFARQKHQYVACALYRTSFDVAYGVQYLLRLIDVAGFGRAVDDLDRITAAAHLHHRRVFEVFRERADVDRRAGDDDLEIDSPAEQYLHIAEQKVDVQAPLVCLVDDQHFVLREPSIAGDLVQQQPVGHHFDQCSVGRLIAEAHGIADLFAERHAELLGNASRDGSGRDSTRLGVPDQPSRAEPGRNAQLRQLRRFTGAGLAGDDHDAVRLEQTTDLVDVLGNRQLVGKRYVRNARASVAQALLCRSEVDRGASGIVAKRALERAHVAQHYRLMRKFATHAFATGGGEKQDRRLDGASTW
jgi:hypothetical protein